MMRLLRYLTLIFFKKKAFPVYLIHLITQNCNASCAHCFVQPKSSNDEMSLSDIGKLCRRLGKNLYQVNLSGGEPFLRNDIVEICKTYISNTPVKVIRISSNGLLVDNITEKTEKIIRIDPAIKVVLELSIDGINGEHDKIRGVPGLFAKVNQTYHQLKKLEAEYPNLKVNVNITVSKYNQEHLIETYHYITRQLKLDSISITLIRGNPKSESAKHFDLDKYEQLVNLVNQDLKRKKIAGYASLVYGNLINAQNILARKRIIKTLREKRYISRCYAGILGLVVESNGRIMGCELMNDELGNIKDDDFDRIWLGEKSARFREKNKTCYCTHECFLTMNILFNYKYSFLLMKEMLGMFIFNMIKYPSCRR